MEAIKIIGLVLAVAIIGGGIYGFFDASKKKFGYDFFTKASVIAGFVAVFSGMTGRYILNSVQTNANVQIYGLVMLAACGLIMLVMTVRNFQHTNFWFGLIGTLLQFSLITVAAFVTIGLLVVYMGIQALSILGQSDSGDSEGVSSSAVDDDWLNSDQNPNSAYYDDSSYFAWK